MLVGLVSDGHKVMEGQDGQGGQSNRFKQVFKYYKRRRPAPSLDQVLDPRNPLHGDHFTPLELQEGEGGGGADLRPVKEWRGVGVKGVGWEALSE